MTRELRPLGEWFRELRERYDLKQAEVASAIDVAVSSYRNYESNNIVPKTKELIALANLYDLTVDEILGFGTKMIFKYDSNQIEDLRKAVRTRKYDLINEKLTPLLSERETVFSAPNLTKKQMEIYANKTIRTYSYSDTDEQLIFYALDRRNQLKYTGKLIHDGFYYSLDILSELKKIRNPFFSDVYSTADIFHVKASSVFADVLHLRFGYKIFAVMDCDIVHVFCKSDNKYIDIRGWTADFCEFKAGLPRDFKEADIIPYDNSKETDIGGEQFANWIIDRNSQFYDVYA